MLAAEFCFKAGGWRLLQPRFKSSVKLSARIGWQCVEMQNAGSIAQPGNRKPQGKKQAYDPRAGKNGKESAVPPGFGYGPDNFRVICPGQKTQSRPPDDCSEP